MFKLSGPIGAMFNHDLGDVFQAKTALEERGYFKRPDYGLTPYPDQPLFDGIKNFQKARGLKIDGVMKPGGETERSLFGQAEAAAPSPIRWSSAEDQAPASIDLDTSQGREPIPDARDFWRAGQGVHVNAEAQSANGRTADYLRTVTANGDLPIYYADSIRSDGPKAVAEFGDLLSQLAKTDPTRADGLAREVSSRLGMDAGSLLGRTQAYPSMDPDGNPFDPDRHIPARHRSPASAPKFQTMEISPGFVAPPVRTLPHRPGWIYDQGRWRREERGGHIQLLAAAADGGADRQGGGNSGPAGAVVPPPNRAPDDGSRAGGDRGEAPSPFARRDGENDPDFYSRMWRGLGKDGTPEQREQILGALDANLPKDPDHLNAFLQGVEPDAHLSSEARPAPESVQRDFQRVLQQNPKTPPYEVPGALGGLYFRAPDGKLYERTDAATDDTGRTVWNMARDLVRQDQLASASSREKAQGLIGAAAAAVGGRHGGGPRRQTAPGHIGGKSGSVRNVFEGEAKGGMKLRADRSERPHTALKAMRDQPDAFRDSVQKRLFDNAVRTDTAAGGTINLHIKKGKMSENDAFNGMARDLGVSADQITKIKGLPGGRRFDLPNGVRVQVRSKSSKGFPTIEFLDKQGGRIGEFKFRFSPQ